jgi:uncharacterized protein (DUF58 family)
MFSIARLLTSTDRKRLAHLQLYARQVMEGINVGMHRSPHKGFSVEFKEHRQYVAGDEIRSIDWKLFGKTDRLYIRQYEEETNLRCTILVDQSGSMGYVGQRSGGVSKHEYAIRLAASLAYMLIEQQDAVGLVTFDSTIRRFIPTRSRPNHLRGILETLAASKAEGETALSDVLGRIAPKLRRRGLLVLVSDGFDDPTPLLRSLSHFRSMRNEVLWFQIWDPDEIDFPFHGRVQFQSLEKSDHQKLVDPDLLRRTYLERLANFRKQLSEGCARQRIDLVHCTTDQPHAALLANYIASRGRQR